MLVPREISRLVGSAFVAGERRLWRGRGCFNGLLGCCGGYLSCVPDPQWISREVLAGTASGSVVLVSQAV